MKRKNEEYHKTKIDIICDLLVKVVLPCIVIGIMLLITFTSHASGNESVSYFPMEQNEGGGFTAENIAIIENSFDLENNYVVMYKSVQFSNGVGYTYALSPKEHGCFFGELNNDLIHFSLYYVGDGQGVVIGRFDIDYAGNTWNTIEGGNVYPSFYNLVSSNYDNTLSYVSNYKVMTNNTENAGVVLKYCSEEPVIVTGHATPPDEFNSPVYTQGHSKPEHVPPTITVNNYTWSTYTPPSVDNSTLEKLVESLTDIVKYNANYLKDNLHNEFTNLINNIKNLIDYIGQTIQYYGDLIIENIQNSITTFYNNMVSLFEPISVALDYISQPLQVEEVVTTIEETQINGDITSVISLSNTAFGIFGTVSEPQSFTIPLDLTGIAILHQTQPFYIDLSWINSAKTYIRAFMWCIVTFGLLYSIVIGIPTMLKDSK